MRALMAMALVGAVMVATPAFADIVTFNNLATDDIYAISGPELDSGGLHFSVSNNGGDSLAAWGRMFRYNANPGGAALFSNYQTPVTVTKIGGGTFNLGSLQIADVHNSGQATGVGFSFINSAGTTSQFYSLDGQPGLQTLSFNMPDVSSFTMSLASGSNAPQFTNIAYSTGRAAGPGAPAPEIGVGLLSALAAGLALFLSRMRIPAFTFASRRRLAAA